MKTLPLLICLFLAATFLPTTAVDLLVLNDGRQMAGNVSENKKQKTATIEVKSGTLIIILKSEIAKMNLGATADVINLKTGERFVGTTELDSEEEITVKLTKPGIITFPRALIAEIKKDISEIPKKPRKKIEQKSSDHSSNAVPEAISSVTPPSAATPATATSLPSVTPTMTTTPAALTPVTPPPTATPVVSPK